MARSRNIKPGFFKNEDLAELGPTTQLLFAGLWMLADREGRLEDRPKRIKAEIFPYYDCDIDGLLTALHEACFIQRYAMHGLSLIQVRNWKKHQSPHHKEVDSELPSPDEKKRQTKTKGNPSTGQVRAKHESSMSQARVNQSASCPPDSLLLIPDSLNLIPDSLNSDSLIPDKNPSSPPAAADSAGKAKPLTAEIWTAYSGAYFDRYGTEPVRNAKINTQLKQFIERVGQREAPQVAAYYVSLNTGWYVQKLHSIGVMLTDAEALRTQWATNTQVTSTAARQKERTSHNAGVVAQVQKELREEGL